MRSTSEERWEPTDVKKPSAPISPDEGNVQGTPPVSGAAFPPGVKRYDERLTPVSLGS